MQYLFAVSTMGFYRDDVHKDMPADALPIAEALYLSLLGKQIEAGEDGMPRELLAEPEEPTTPASVTMRQARLALLGAGLLHMVDAALSALPSPQKEAAEIEWEFAATVDRESPTTMLLAQALGMTDEELDQLFTLAATL